MPDGYTLTFTLPAAVAVNPSLYPKLPYDPLRDFAPVTQLNTIALLLIANPGVPAKSVKELIALAKAKRGHVTFASSGNGSASHFAMELFKLMAGVDMVHIPYKGGGPALTDIVGGQVQLMSGPVIAALPMVKAGRVKALAVTSDKRRIAASATSGSSRRLHRGGNVNPRGALLDVRRASLLRWMGPLRTPEKRSPILAQCRHRTRT